MPDLLNCPSCSRQLRVPPDLLGKQVKCPSCGTTFAGTADPLPAAASPPPATPDNILPQLELPPDDTAAPPPPATAVFPPAAVPSRPAPGPADEAVSCPYCGATIRRGAVRCPSCGEDLAEEDERPWERSARAPVRRDCEPHRGNLVLTLGIISLAVLICWPLAVVGLPLGIVAWVMGTRDLEKIKLGVMDPAGQGLVQGGRVCGIVGTILNGLYVLGCGAYIAIIACAGMLK
jgi:hypothetical protein